MRRSGAATALALVCALAPAYASCRQVPSSSDGSVAHLRVGSAFGPFSEPLAGEYGERLPDLDVSMVPAPDSEAVIEGIEQGTVDVGITFADLAYSAYWRRQPPDSEASALRGVMLLQPLPQYLLAAGGTRIEGVADLHGRTLVVGQMTSYSAYLGPMLVEAFGIAVIIRTVPTREEAVGLLTRGEADAMLFAGYVYPDEIMQPAIERGAYFVPIDGPPVDRLRLERPFIRRTAIQRGIIPGQDRIIPTIGVDLVVVCRRDLPESLVHDMTAALMSAYPELSGVEANLRFLNPDEAPATPIPLHPGAARFYRERELSR